MLRVQKNDWCLSLGLAIVLTGLSVYARRLDVLLYSLAISCGIIALCSFFKIQRRIFEGPQKEESESVAVADTPEKYRILLSLLLAAFSFCSLGFFSQEQTSTVYHFALLVVVILAPFFLFATFLFAIVSVRSCLSSNADKDNR